MTPQVGGLRSLPAEPFDAAEHANPRVDSKALVTARRNQYPVPVSLAGPRAAARICAREIAPFHDGRRVARHLASTGALGSRRSSTTVSGCCG